MARKLKPVEVISINTEVVEKDDAFPEAYAFYIKLSDKPDLLWERYFEDEWNNAFYSMKREISVVGDKLRLVFGYGDNIESHVKFARQLVERTNKRIEEHYRRAELKETREPVKQEDEDIEGKKEEIRKKLREL